MQPLLIESEDLVKEASDFSFFYAGEKYKDAPLDQKHIAINSSAHGFFAGVRWAEKHYDLRKEQYAAGNNRSERQSAGTKA